VDAAQCRVFWLALPPLSEKQRIAAARTALRARIASETTSAFALATQPRSDGLWCAAVFPRTMAWPANATVEAAHAPWSANTVTWARNVAAPFAISARGESVALNEPQGELPTEIVQLCTHGVTALHVLGALTPEEKTQWEAQLGVPVKVVNAPTATAIQWSATQPFQLARTTPQPTRSRAPLVAALCGAAFLVLQGWSYTTARAYREQINAEIDKETTKHKQTATAWRAWVASTAPHAARDAGSALLEATLPALAATAARVTVINVEPKSLTLEWSTLSDAERAQFERDVQARGASVIASGKRARVVRP
jgi:hypothetical protein